MDDFNREVLAIEIDLNLPALRVIRTLSEVREITETWMRQYNEERPHDSLDDLTPREYLATRNSLESSNYACN